MKRSTLLQLWIVGLLSFPVILSAREEPRIEFLGIQEGRRAIVDETVEPYFSLLHPLEMSVKTGQPITGDTIESQREEAKRRYQNSVLEFTPQEQAAIRDCATRVHELLAEDFPRFTRQPWKFIKVASNIEGGLPHTRGDMIVISDRLVGIMLQTHTTSPENARAGFGPLLVHEQMHVVQRLHPGMFLPLYTEVWGFEKVDKIDLPDSIRRRIIVNPDGVDIGWVYPIREGDQTVRTITPLLLFEEEATAPRMPRDFREVAVELVKTEAGYTAVDPPVVRPLEGFPGYLPGLHRHISGNLYHPNEAAADAFAKVFTVHGMPRGEDWNRANVELKQGMGPTIDWFRDAFGALE